MTMLAHINPYAEHLTREESLALHMLLDKHERYISKGWVREAQGMKSAILILWQVLARRPVIDTGWGEI